MNRNKKPNIVSGDANIVSWVITAILLGVNAFPVGLFFLIAKLSGHDIIGRLFMAFQEGFRNNSSSDANRSSVNRSGQYTVSNSSSRSRAQTGSYTQNGHVYYQVPRQESAESASVPSGAQTAPAPSQ